MNHTISRREFAPSERWLTAVLALLALLTVMAVAGTVRAQDVAKNNPPKAVKSDAISLALTPDEIKTGPPIYQALIIQQQKVEQAVYTLRITAKQQPDNTEALARVALSLSGASDNRDAVAIEWEKWLVPTQKAHGCEGCALDLKKNEFIRAEKPAK